MGSVTLQGGETLQSLAQGAYGDASLWYLIAQANGLTGNNDLHVGETLIIPSAVASSNNASTFKPYDAGKVVGDTTPNLPLPPADEGCGGLMAIILIIIIIIVIIIYTSGAGAEAAGGAGATGDAAAVTVVDEFGAIVANSAYAAPANFGTLFLQGAGMNLAGQVLSGKEEIDWGGVLLGGVGGVIGGGIDASGVGGQGLTGTIVRGALKSAINQGLQIATGRQKDFNWTGVAASGLGAGLGHALGDNKVFDGLGPVGGAVMRGIDTGAATTLMSGAKSA